MHLFFFINLSFRKLFIVRRGKLFSTACVSSNCNQNKFGSGGF